MRSTFLQKKLVCKAQIDPTIGFSPTISTFISADDYYTSLLVLQIPLWVQ